MKKIMMALAASVLGVVAVSGSKAALLNNGLGLIPSKPDVSATLLPLVGEVGIVPAITYTASSRTLSLYGYPARITYPNGTFTDFASETSYISISIVLSGSNTNPTPVSGTIDVYADLSGLGDGDDKIYASSAPLEFGFGDSQLDFIFGNNTGVVGTGQNIGVHVTSRAGLPSTFDFSRNFNTGEAEAKLDAWVPEPGCMAALVPAAALVSRRRRA